VITLQVVDVAMVETAATKRAVVSYYPIVVTTRQTTKIDILPTKRERPRQWMARNIERRGAYFFAIIRHTSTVFSICVF
jgi:hypothetical protein